MNSRQPPCTQITQLKGFNLTGARVTTVTFFHRFSTYPSLDNPAAFRYAHHSARPGPKSKSNLMASPAVASKFRAVLCRHCAKPIRVPALIMKKEASSSHSPILQIFITI